MATKRQHYIPQMILRNYTIFRPPMARPMLFQYDLENRCERMVTTQDACVKNNLYELRGEDGRIIASTRNAIENCLSVFEGEWTGIIKKLERRADLTEKDLTFLYFLIPIQFLRTPSVLQEAAQWLQQISSVKISDQEAKRYARMASLICGEPDPNKSFLLNALTELCCEKQLTVFVADGTRGDSFILNGEYPVVALGLPDDIKQAILCFPITPTMCLSFIHKSNNAFYQDVCSSFVTYLNQQSCSRCGRMLYSSASIADRLSVKSSICIVKCGKPL